MPQLNNETLLLAFVALTAVALFIQAIVMLLIFASLRKAARSITDELEQMRSSIMPIVYNTRDLMTRLTPKVEAAIDDLAEMSGILRDQSVKLESTAAELLERVRHQSSRIDAMLSGVLDTADRAGGFVAEAVSKPVKQISSILASLKVMVETLRAPAPPAPAASRPTRTAGEKDMFV